MFTGKSKAAAKPLTSWSFSRYLDWVKCPYAFRKKHIDKIKDPGSPAMERGTAIHSMAEAFIKGSITEMPAELKLFAEEFEGLREMYQTPGSGLVVEDQWAFDRQWRPSGWMDWNTTWLRVKLDIGMRADDAQAMIFKPIDWKTGKNRDYKNDEYRLQLELYALSTFKMLPEIEKVVPLLAYLDEGTIYPKEDEPIIYHKSDEKMLANRWEGRVDRMFSDTELAPTPGKHCQYCQHSKAKGGDCIY